MLGVNVTCAETDHEAAQLRASVEAYYQRLSSGDTGAPLPIEVAIDELGGVPDPIPHSLQPGAWPSRYLEISSTVRDLLERMVHDDAVQHEITYRLDETITGAHWLLDAPAGAASDHFWPTMPRYWDWHDDLAFDFALDDDIEHRIRNLVKEEGLEDDLPQNWEITDLTL